MELFDEHYSRALARVTIRGMTENAKKGYWNGGYPPLGYVVEKDKNGKSKLKVNPVWTPVVKKIFDLSYRGVGAQRICQILLKEGIKNKNGRAFTKNTIWAFWKTKSIWMQPPSIKRIKNHKKV